MHQAHKQRRPNKKAALGWNPERGHRRKGREDDNTP